MFELLAKRFKTLVIITVLLTFNTSSMLILGYSVFSESIEPPKIENKQLILIIIGRLIQGIGVGLFSLYANAVFKEGPVQESLRK